MPDTAEIRERLLALANSLETCTFRETRWAGRGYNERDVDVVIDEAVAMIEAIAFACAPGEIFDIDARSSAAPVFEQVSAWDQAEPERHVGVARDDFTAEDDIVVIPEDAETSVVAPDIEDDMVLVPETEDADVGAPDTAAEVVVPVDVGENLVVEDGVGEDGVLPPEGPEAPESPAQHAPDAAAIEAEATRTIDISDHADAASTDDDPAGDDSRADATIGDDTIGDETPAGDAREKVGVDTRGEGHVAAAPHGTPSNAAVWMPPLPTWSDADRG